MALTLERPETSSPDKDENNAEGSEPKRAYARPTLEEETRSRELSARTEELQQQFRELRKRARAEAIPSDETLEELVNDLNGLRAVVAQELEPDSILLGSINLELAHVEHLKEFKKNLPILPSAPDGSKVPLPTDPDEDEADYTRARNLERADNIHKAASKGTEYAASPADASPITDIEDELDQPMPARIDDVAAQFENATDKDATGTKLPPTLVRGEPINPNRTEQLRRVVANQHIGDRVVESVGLVQNKVGETGSSAVKQASQQMESLKSAARSGANEATAFALDKVKSAPSALRENAKQNMDQMRQDVSRMADVGSKAAELSEQAMRAVDSSVLFNELNEHFPSNESIRERARAVPGKASRAKDGVIEAARSTGSTLKQDFRDNFEAMRQDLAIARQNIGQNSAQVKEDLASVKNLGPQVKEIGRAIGQGAVSEAQAARRGMKEFMDEGLQGPPVNRRFGPEVPTELQPPVEPNPTIKEKLSGAAKSVGPTLRQDFKDNFGIMRQDLTRARGLGANMVDKAGSAVDAVNSTVIMNRMNDAIPKSEDIFTRDNAKKVGRKTASIGTGLVKDSVKTGGRGLKNIGMAATNFGVTEVKGVRNIAKGEVQGIKNIALAAAYPMRRRRRGQESVEPTLPPIEKPRRSPPPTEDDPVAYKFRTENQNANGSAKGPEATSAPPPTDEDLNDLGLSPAELGAFKRRRAYWRRSGFSEDEIRDFESQLEQAHNIPNPKDRDAVLRRIDQEIFNLRNERKKAKEAAEAAQSAANPNENQPAPANGERPKTEDQLEIERKQRMEEIFTYSVQIQTLLNQFPAEISKDLIAYRGIKKAHGDVTEFIKQERQSLINRHYAESAVAGQILLTLKELWVNILNDFQRVRPGWAGHIELQKELEERLRGNRLPRTGQAEFKVNEHPERIREQFKPQDGDTRRKLLKDATDHLEPAVANEVKSIIGKLNTRQVNRAQAETLIAAFNRGKSETDELGLGKHPNEPVTSSYLIQIGENSDQFIEVNRNRMGEVFLRPITEKAAEQKRILPNDELVNVEGDYVGRRVQTFDMKYLAGTAMGYGKDVAAYVTMDSGAMMKISQRGPKGEIVVEDAAHPGYGKILRPHLKNGSSDEFELGQLSVGKSTEFLTKDGPHRTGTIREITLVYTNSHDLLPKEPKRSRNSSAPRQPALPKSQVMSNYHQIERSSRRRIPAAWNQPARRPGPWTSLTNPQTA